MENRKPNKENTQNTQNTQRRSSSNFRKNFNKKRRNDIEQEFDVNLVSIDRVTKVNTGGKTLRIRVMVVIGDRKGQIGAALAKGKDVKSAQVKAINKAKKNLFKVTTKGQTIPHEVKKKYGATKIFLKPAVPGTGVICGGAVRSVVEAAGIKDILSKVYGSKNTISCVYATIEALKDLRLYEKNETK